MSPPRKRCQGHIPFSRTIGFDVADDKRTAAVLSGCCRVDASAAQRDAKSVAIGASVAHQTDLFSADRNRRRLPNDGRSCQINHFNLIFEYTKKIIGWEGVVGQDQSVIIRPIRSPFRKAKHFVPNGPKKTHGTASVTVSFYAVKRTTTTTTTRPQDVCVCLFSNRARN